MCIRDSCDRVLAGEKLIVDTAASEAELTELPATKKHNQQQLDNLRKLLD